VFAPVRAVAAAPPTTGLVASAPPVAGDDGRWETGLAWVPERCGLGHQLLPACSPTDPGAFTPERGAAAYYRPVGVRFADQCSTMGGELDTERLRRRAEASTPYVVARELWDGALGQTDSFTVRGETLTNARLADADATVVGSGGADLLPALARLEQAALEESMGQRVMLHLPVRLSARLADFARRVGSDLLTRQDNWVVIDAGYPGTGPAGQSVATTAWAYATTPVHVRTSPLVVEAEPASTVDRGANTVTAWAQRVFAATFDPCVHLATEITI
jgi:hypothetical protein